MNKVFTGILTLATVLFLWIAPVFVAMYDTAQYEALYNGQFPLGNDDQRFLTELVVEYISGTDVSLMPFTLEERMHLNDVRAIVQVLEIVAIAAGLVLLVLIPYTWWYKQQRAVVLAALWYGSLFSLLSISLCAIGIIVWFDAFFVHAHYLLFPQGGWLFESSSLLIRLFPESFFVSISRHIVLLIVGFSLAVWIGVSALRYAILPQKDGEV